MIICLKQYLIAADELDHALCVGHGVLGRHLSAHSTTRRVANTIVLIMMVRIVHVVVYIGRFIVAIVVGIVVVVVIVKMCRTATTSIVIVVVCIANRICRLA